MAESPVPPNPDPASAERASDVAIERAGDPAGRSVSSPAAAQDDPFAAFSEWAGLIDDTDYADL